MVSGDSLEAGKHYYLFSFIDEDYSIPEIRTLIYVGKNLLPERRQDGDEWYFQDPDSFLEYGVLVEHDNPEINNDVFAFRDSDLWLMFDLPGLIVRLQEFEATGV